MRGAASLLVPRIRRPTTTPPTTTRPTNPRVITTSKTMAMSSFLPATDKTSWTPRRRDLRDADVLRGYAAGGDEPFATPLPTDAAAGRPSAAGLFALCTREPGLHWTRIPIRTAPTRTPMSSPWSTTAAVRTTTPKPLAPVLDGDGAAASENTVTLRRR